MFCCLKVDHKTLSFKARVKPGNHVWMEDARLKNLVICQPEYRNRFNKVGCVRLLVEHHLFDFRESRF